MKRVIHSFRQLTTSLLRNPTSRMLALVLMVLMLPLTVTVLNQQQNLRQEAQSLTGPQLVVSTSRNCGGHMEIHWSAGSYDTSNGYYLYFSDNANFDPTVSGGHVYLVQQGPIRIVPTASNPYFHWASQPGKTLYYKLTVSGTDGNFTTPAKSGTTSAACGGQQTGTQCEVAGSGRVCPVDGGTQAVCADPNNYDLKTGYAGCTADPQRCCVPKSNTGGAPSAPTGVSGTPGATCGIQNKISWNASSSGNVSGYYIYRGSSSGFTPSGNNDIGNVGANTTSFTDPSGVAGNSYYYKVASWNSAGPSYSNAVQVNCSGGTGGVSNNDLPKGWLDSASCTEFQGWACDLDRPLKSISVHFYKDGAFGQGTYIGQAVANVTRSDVSSECSGTSAHGFRFTVPQSLKDGQSHQIYAHGINTNSVGTDTGSNPLLQGVPKTITCGGGTGDPPVVGPLTPSFNPPSRPTVTARTSSQCGGKIDISWSTSTNVTIGYWLYRGTTSGFTPAGSNIVTNRTTPYTSSSPYVDSGLTPGSTYYYKVTASGSSNTTSNAASAVASAACGSNQQLLRLDGEVYDDKDNDKVRDSGSNEIYTAGGSYIVYGVAQGATICQGAINSSGKFSCVVPDRTQYSISIFPATSYTPSTANPRTVNYPPAGSLITTHTEFIPVQISGSAANSSGAECNVASNRPNGCGCDSSSQCSSNLCIEPLPGFGKSCLPASSTTDVAVDIAAPGFTPSSPNVQEQATVGLYTSTNTLVKEASGTVTYDPSSQSFKGTINMGNVPSGNYLVKTKLSNSLQQDINSSPINISSQSVNTVPSVSVLLGDANDDNTFDVRDFNILYDCFNNLTSCNAAARDQSDFNGDGVINILDYSLFVTNSAAANN